MADAGYDIQGYVPKMEDGYDLKILNDPEIALFLSRPQSAPIELSRKLIDIALIGDDWVQEETTNNNLNGIWKIGDLEYGKTRLVLAVPNHSRFSSLSDLIQRSFENDKPILCFSELVNLARKKIMDNETYRELYGNKEPLTQAKGIVVGNNEMVQVILSDGETESYIRKGADLIADITQTGSSLKRYGLIELEQIMESNVGLYAGPGCVGWKTEKAKDIFDSLYGVILARKNYDVKFNIPTENIEIVTNYLIGQGLCADEPTVNRGRKFSQVNIIMPRDRYPLAKEILRRKYKATAIIPNKIQQFIK